MEDFANQFNKITFLVSECLSALDDIDEIDVPSGVDMMLASDFASANETGTVHTFEEAAPTLYGKAFEEINTKLQEARSLAFKLSTGSYEEPFTPRGILALRDDIRVVNLFGTEIHYCAYVTLQQLSQDSPQASLITSTYQIAEQLYTTLQLSVRKALPKGQLPAIQPLKLLTKSPSDV